MDFRLSLLITRGLLRKNPLDITAVVSPMEWTCPWKASGMACHELLHPWLYPWQAWGKTLFAIIYPCPWFFDNWLELAYPPSTGCEWLGQVLGMQRCQLRECFLKLVHVSCWIRRNLREVGFLDARLRLEPRKQAWNGLEQLPTAICWYIYIYLRY